MDRRSFLSLAALAVAGQAAQRVWPFRVYSIPKEIVVPTTGALTIEILRMAEKQIMERLGSMPGPFDVLPVVGTVYGSDGSPAGHIKITQVNGKVLTCNTGAVLCKPGDMITLADEIYPIPYKYHPSCGAFRNLARS